jgi:hypothetical protein
MTTSGLIPLIDAGIIDRNLFCIGRSIIFKNKKKNQENKIQHIGTPEIFFSQHA